jgi:4-amino-4-deoxy-L-arabinose transferase-like glycosyltransferase
MEGRSAGVAAQEEKTGAVRLGHRLDWGPLLALLLLAAGLRVWLLSHTEVAARDSIHFIRIAWQLEHEPWLHVLKHIEMHPGYPLLILLMSQPVAHFMQGPDTVLMQFSAQLVSVLAGTLLVVPTYYLGRELFNRTVGFWAAVLFQFLPASCRVLSDGLSEATFLLLAVTALYLAVRALRGGSPLLFGLCGLFGGLAYLTRPEGALVAAATALVLLAMQLVRAYRRPWRTTLICGTTLSLAAILVGGPLVLITGKLTPKPSFNRSMGDGPRGEVPAGEDQRAPVAVFQARPVVMASLPPLAIWHQDDKQQRSRVWWGLQAVVGETLKGFNYVAWVPTLMGLWLFRGRFRDTPGTWVLLLVCLAVTLLLWRVAAFMGYVSERHALLIILCGSYWAVAAVTLIGRRLADLIGTWTPRAAVGHRGKTTCRLLTVLLLLALLVPGLPRDFEQLHVDRRGFRAVGLWLAEHAGPGDKVLDPYSWPMYYAGRAFHDPEPPLRAPYPYQYVVVEKSGNPHPHLVQHKLAESLAARGREVYRWSGRHRKDVAEIIVYALPPPHAP